MKSSPKGSLQWAITLVFKILGVVLVAVFGLILCISFCGPDRVYIGFQKEAKNYVNPIDVQKWALPILAQSKSGDQIPNEKLPWSVRRIGNPGNVSALVSPLQNNTTNVIVFFWGGGFGSWGLIVGDSNYTGLHDDQGIRVTTWVPGVYFYRGKH